MSSSVALVLDGWGWAEFVATVSQEQPFLRTGGVTLEVIVEPSAGAADSFYGVAYRVRDLQAAHARLTAAGFALTEPRAGGKPGTHVFSVRASTCGVPTLFIRDASRD